MPVLIFGAERGAPRRSKNRQIKLPLIKMDADVLPVLYEPGTLTPAEGIYYVVRFPSRWTLVADPFIGGKDNDHYKWWEEVVAGMVARDWGETLGWNATALREEIRLLTYAFPRGRVTKVGEKFFVLHGGDLKVSMKIIKKDIENAFGVAGKCSWHLDEHEHCQADDKGQMRDMLGIKEDWDAV